MYGNSSDVRDQVLAIGGCHLTGYIVGEEHSFLRNAFEAAGRAGVRYLISKPVPISRAGEVARMIAGGSQPDIVIIQLGNYETGRSLSAAIPSSRTLGMREDGLPPPDTQAPMIIPFLKAVLKTGPLLVKWARKQRHVDVEALSNGIEKALVSMREDFPQAQFLILGTFPDADFHVMRARRALNTKLEAMAERFGIEYLDPIRELGSPRSAKSGFTKSNFMADPNHLNLVGHRALGIALSPVIKKLKLRTP